MYGTLVGLLNHAEPDFGASVAARVHKELQVALDDHAPLAIRGLSRFVVELMNARVLEPAAALELLETFIRVSKEDGIFPARCDWFMCLALDTLVLCGKELSVRKPENLAAVMGSLRTYAKKRKPLRVLAPVLLPFGSDTTEDEASRPQRPGSSPRRVPPPSQLAWLGQWVGQWLGPWLGPWLGGAAPSRRRRAAGARALRRAVGPRLDHLG